MVDLQHIIDGIVSDLSPRLGEGKVADYIPQLACVGPKQFGIAIATVDGHPYSAGDAAVPFAEHAATRQLCGVLPISTEARYS